MFKKGSENKGLRIGLLPRILIAMVIGTAAGYTGFEAGGRICATFNSIFGQLLNFFVPLIIVGFVTPAIAEIGQKAGKMLLFTAALAYLATISAGFISYFTADTLFPQMISVDTALNVIEQEGKELLPYFELAIPPLFPVMTALVTAFMTGLGIAYCPSPTLKSAAEEFRSIMIKAINKVIIPLLPIYIFAIFYNMTVSGEVAKVITAFAQIILVILVLHIFVLLLQYCIAALFNRKNPLKMLWTMMPAYFTALGTQSSAATIPVTLEQTVKMGVSKDVAGFTVPLCATIHMSGSTLKIVACALALMLMQGMHYDFGMFAHFILLLAITIIAAPGIPGGAIMASLGVLTSVLGFNDHQNALIIALYIAMDSFGTACNVTGDGALSVIVDFFFGKKQVKPNECA